MVRLAVLSIFKWKLILSDLDKEQKVKQLSRVVCICKGIALSKIIEALKNSDTVAEVNKKTGCGSGGCKGERCGPRISALLNKLHGSK